MRTDNTENSPYPNLCKRHKGKRIPKTAGRRVRITFNKLDLFNTNPLRNDQLHIYNGKEAKAEKHLRTLLSDKTPVVLLSASEDGALTVTLKSTTGVTKSGFEAVVTEFVPQAMALDGIKQTQLEANKPVMAGAKKQEILEVNIQAKDVLQPLTATSFTFSTEGSTEGVLSAAELWTKDRGVMAPARKLGEVTSIGKTCTVTLSSPYTLMDGDNAFVLYYDIAETAQTGGQVDASLVSILLSGKEEKPSETAVPGSRPIQNTIHSSEGHNTYRIYGEWKFLPTMTFNKYAGGRVDQMTTLLPSKAGEVVELDFDRAVYAVTLGKRVDFFRRHIGDEGHAVLCLFRTAHPDMSLGQFDGEVRAESVLVLQARESMVVHELRRTRQKFDVLLPAHSRILAWR